MKKIASKNLQFVPASHEDALKPGAWKKVLFKKEDFGGGGVIQMVNWASLPVGSKFKTHYHDDMDEVFIIISGKAQIKAGKEEDILEKGDAVLIPLKTVHQMQNLGTEDLEYVVLGISLGKGGQTHVI